MGIMAIPIPIQVFSYSFPFPFRILSPIPITMGMPWDSHSHWESHSHGHVYCRRRNTQVYSTSSRCRTHAMHPPHSGDTNNCSKYLYTYDWQIAAQETWGGGATSPAPRSLSTSLSPALILPSPIFPSFLCPPLAVLLCRGSRARDSVESGPRLSPA